MTNIQPACPFCYHVQVSKLRDIISPFNQKHYQLMQCATCELQFFTPLVFEDVYENEIIEEYIRFHQGERILPPWTKELLHVIEMLPIPLEHKKILEIGAGDGVNYSALHRLHHVAPAQYYAVEFDSKSIEQCRLRGITHIIHTQFDCNTASQIHSQFDIILLLEVLEHQPNPKEFLEFVFNLLDQDGLIILTVPNRERFFLQYVEFQGDLPPHHFLRFNTTFFRKNFAQHILYLQDFRHIYKVKSIKAAALKLTSRFNIHPAGWFVLSPFVPLLHGILRLMAFIRGEGIIVVLKK